VREPGVNGSHRQAYLRLLAELPRFRPVAVGDVSCPLVDRNPTTIATPRTGLVWHREFTSGALAAIRDIVFPYRSRGDRTRHISDPRSAARHVDWRGRGERYRSIRARGLP